MRFVQGIDYGPRKGTMGIAIHMAEGGDGTVPYLARHPGESDHDWRSRVRGVSAHFVILTSGEVVQMVAWGNASGSMNPMDRGPSAGFYRTQIIQGVLGGHYVDPNAWSLSVEICGFRAVGPNEDQTQALVELVAECRRHFPSLRGAYGHHDQTDTKGCPGTAAGMMAAWKSFGHGLFREEAVQIYAVPGRFRARFIVGTILRETPGGVQVSKVTDGTAWYDLVGQEDVPPDPGEWYLIDARGSAPMTWANASAIAAREAIPDPGAPPAKTYPVTVGGKLVGGVTLP